MAMGEVVMMSSYEDKKKIDEFEETHSPLVKKRKGHSSRNGFMLRWEKLIPRMEFRVLLVEADDSTRQIIVALLRKCSYKVAAVSDGLEAWEILKGRPNNIDLILTEVDLPSISGYALLSLIMEHDICKHIPVIMMSSHDSISTVYKCMLRGAADYLVKPIRRNELRNLWQHVWRRQSSLAGANSPHDDSVGQGKVEATSENNTASNYSSRGIGLIQNNKECIDKGSDAQSSCTKPDAKADSTPSENINDILQPVWGELSPNDIRMQNHEARRDFSQKLAMHEHEAEGSAAAFQDINRMIVDEDAEPESQRIHDNITLEGGENRVPVTYSREAIDFMGTSVSHNVSTGTAKSKFEFSPHLDLCLTRYSPTGFEVQNIEEKCTLRQSNASAFAPYTGKPFQPGHLTMSSVSNERGLEANSRRKFSSNSGPSPRSERSIISLANGQTREQRVFPVKSSSNGLSLNNLCTSYGSIFSPTFCKQSGASPILSTSSGNQLEPNSEVNPIYQSTWKSNSENIYQLCKTANDSANRSLQKQDLKFESLEDRGHISPTTDQSTTSSLCNGGTSHLNMGYRSTSGSNSNFDQVTIARAATERKGENGILHNADVQQSIRREAALNKFRLKRKDRCYEKKVRYESRKKLAEQRPRVKGQFVRQIAPQPAESKQHHHNSIEG
ncbi:two-component response regulator-like APRR9 [Euphorbia lathyris]|uniref:two-component response regulator-like APRR9 n=1 Tax=Euphorbia lathyris TaxID=212925 RepID=UPI003314380A